MIHLAKLDRFNCVSYIKTSYIKTEHWQYYLSGILLLMDLSTTHLYDKIDKVEKTLWRAKKLTSHGSIEYAVVICETNNINFNENNGLLFVIKLKL